MKEIVKIAGYNVTKLNATDYEIANLQESLDFYFQVDEEMGETECFVFDSTIPNDRSMHSDAFLHVFSTNTIEDAVTDSMKFKKADMKRIKDSE